jgi:hypothetical protein
LWPCWSAIQAQNLLSVRAGNYAIENNFYTNLGLPPHLKIVGVAVLDYGIQKYFPHSLLERKQIVIINEEITSVEWEVLPYNCILLSGSQIMREVRRSFIYVHNAPFRVRAGVNSRAPACISPLNMEDIATAVGDAVDSRIRELIIHNPFPYHPRSLGSDCSQSCLGTVLSCPYGLAHMASMDEGDTPKPISSDPQRPREERNEYGRNGSQPFGGYLGEHRNPLKDDAVLGGAFILGGSIFLILLAFVIKDAITRRDEERYLIKYRKKQKERGKDKTDSAES